MSAPALELQHVWLAYRDLPVLEDVTLTLEQHDYMAILGPNGGGKTTLLKVILGILNPDRGTVRVFGQRPSRARGMVGYVPQHFRVDLDFPIRVIDVVLMGRLGSRRLLSRETTRNRQVALNLLDKVEMRDHAHRPVGTLSGGQLQRVLLARALAVEPKLLLLDEPTASMDERIGRSVWELLEELSHEMTVVAVSHDVGAVSRSVRSIACLNRRLYSHGGPELTPEMVQAVYGCPIDLVAHGQPHRVLPEHEGAHK